MSEKFGPAGQCAHGLLSPAIGERRETWVVMFIL